ncbi:MGMT family protein [Bacillus massilinigeriensis]|uniref:MGMT family protein n=1 Tax=Bacillus massilionigeriensis TaxID=1805475 RepID=UPI00096B29FB|nr:MGMT family protein [Bacillus massilionigeriensis]
MVEREINLKGFTERVINIIQQIPSGKVMTYGQIAKLAGSPRGARQVVRILHSMSEKYSLPWHRVVNAKGEIGLKGEVAFYQRSLLEAEGIGIRRENSLDLERYRYNPSNMEFIEYEFFEKTSENTEG